MAVTAGSRLRVALDATPLLGTPTGVAAFCAGALGGLAARDGIDVRAFAVSWRRRQGITALLPDSVTAVTRAMPARPLHLAWRWLGGPAIERFTGPLDVVHGTNFVVPPARRAARVVTVHDLTAVRFPELCQPVSLGFPAQVRRAVAGGAFVHTPSAFVAAEVVELLGVDPARVRPVHHGITPAPAAATDGPAPDGPAPDGPLPAGPPPAGPAVVLPPGTRRYVLALGTVEPRKDLPTLVRAFAAVAGRHPDVALVLAGPDGWGSAALAQAVAASPVAARICRLGFVAPGRRDQLLAGAAAFAYPSVYEGFGFPPLEAMVAGVPVVASTAGALLEVLGDAARLVPAGDEEMLAGALDQVLGDQALAGDLVARGRRRAGEFGWERCAEGLVELYAEAVAARGIEAG